MLIFVDNVVNATAATDIVVQLFFCEPSYYSYSYNMHTFGITCRLADGHFYTSVTTVALDVGGSATEYLVLSSYLATSDAAGSYQPQRAEGLISLFEVSMAQDPNNNSPDTTSVKYSLVLHGTCVVDSVPMSVCLATPMAQTVGEWSFELVVNTT